MDFIIDVSSYADDRDYYMVMQEVAARRYRFSAGEKSCPDYTMTFKHVAANYIRERGLG